MRRQDVGPLVVLVSLVATISVSTGCGSSAVTGSPKSLSSGDSSTDASADSSTDASSDSSTDASSDSSTDAGSDSSAVGSTSDASDGGMACGTGTWLLTFPAGGCEACPGHDGFTISLTVGAYGLVQDGGYPVFTFDSSSCTAEAPQLPCNEVSGVVDFEAGTATCADSCNNGVIVGPGMPLCSICSGVACTLQKQ